MKFFDDHGNGIKEYYHREGDKVYIKTTQDVENALDLNKRDRNNDSGNWKGDFHKVASVPLSLMAIWNKELKDSGHPNPNILAKENSHILWRKLNDRMYGKLRTKEGNI